MRLLLARASVALLLTAAAAGACDCGDGGAALTPLHARLDVEPASLPLADTYVGASRTATLTLSSTGTAAVRIERIELEGVDTGDGFTSFDLRPFSLDDVPESVAPGVVANVQLTFAPTRAGPYGARVVIESDAEDNPSVKVRASVNALAQPDCDDDNDCTDDAFDTNAGVCDHVAREGACDDGSACTENDRCAEGRCVGDAVACADALSCTHDACDPEVGCVFVPDDGACADDGDPCTLDVCDPTAFAGSGCVHAPAPDGTPCGSFEQCVDVDLCLSQQCVTVAIPDGARCNDADLCTDADVCAAGACSGAPILSPPVVRSETYRVTNPCALLDDAVVFLEPVLHVMPLDSLVPEVRVGGVRGQKCTVQPGGRRVAVTNELGATPGVTVVDLGDPRAPAVSAAVPFTSPLVVGGDATRVFVCDLVDRQLTAIDWVDGVGGALDDAGICSLAARNALAFSGHDDVVIDVDGDASVSLGGDSGRVFTLDASGAHARGNTGVPRPGAPTSFQHNDFVDGERAISIRRPGLGEVTDHIFVVDLHNPDAPDTVEWAPPPEIIALSIAFGTLHAPFDYVQPIAAAPVRLDLRDIHDVVVDPSWRAPDATVFTSVVLADDRHVLFATGDTTFGALSLGSALPGASGPATPLLGTGHLADVVAGDGSAATTANGAFVATNGGGVVSFDNATLDAAPRLQLASTINGPGFDFEIPFVVGDGGVFGLGNQADAAVLTQATFDGGFAPRAIGATTDAVTAYPVVITTLDVGGGIASLASMSLALPTPSDRIDLPSLEGCAGVGVVGCLFGNCPSVPMTLSACAAPGSLTALAPISLVDVAPHDLVSSAMHGSHASLLGATRAALVDLANPSAPTVVETPLLTPANPGPFTSIFVTDAYDETSNTWLIVTGEFASGAHAYVLDTGASAGATLLRDFRITTDFFFQDAEGNVGDAARRALLVDRHVAVVSDWDGAFAFDDGHSVAFYDLDADPPVRTATVPIAGQPLRAFRRADGAIVVVRVNGISVIRPECAGP